MSDKEAKVFAVYSGEGKLVNLVEAQTVKQVKEYLLAGKTIEVASALTVARSGLDTEKA